MHILTWHCNLIFDTFFSYQVDSVAEEVERRGSTNDLVNPYNLFESPSDGFLGSKKDEGYIDQNCDSKWSVFLTKCIGIHIWRGRPVTFGRYHGRCCKGIWGSSGAFISFNSTLCDAKAFLLCKSFLIYVVNFL